MKNIRNSVKLFDFTSFEFPEFLFSKLGSDGRLPFWLKCISFGTLLYCMGVVATYASNTLLPWTETSLKTAYLLDYSFMTICAVLVCTLISLFLTLRKLDDAMVQVSKRIGALSTPADKTKFMEYISYIRLWMPVGEKVYEKPWFWYYLDTIGGTVLGALFSFYWIANPTSLWWGTIQHKVAALYFVSFCAVVGYIGGAIVFAIMGSIKAVRRYCRDFITPDRVFALNPDKVGGLRPLGQFSLGLDISFAISSFVIFSYLVQGVPVTHPVVIITLLLYTIVLVVVFFVPLGAAHNAMLEAKEQAYNQVNEIFKKINARISSENKKLNHRHIETFRDVCFLYERVSKMAVWPLNIGILLKFVATSSFPIVGSLIVAYVSQLLGI